MRSPRLSTADRGLSPVVGGALLLAITVLLVSVSAVTVFGLADDKPPAPTANFELEHDGGGQYALVMTDGETIDGDRITLVGVESPETLAGEELVAGEQYRVTPQSETVRIVWTEDAGDPVTYTLRTFDVEGPLTRGTVGFDDGTIFTGRGGDIVSIEENGSAVTTVHSSGNVEALGSPDADVTGSGGNDLPFVTSGEAVGIVDATGSVTTVADSGDIPGSVATSKTRPAVGSWNGSANSVFFVNQNNDRIYRATPGEGPQEVAAPGDGAQAIAGPTDVDDDGDDELVFADASQTIQYVEPDGTVVDTTQSLGSSTGIGAGSLGTLAGYAGDVAVGVDGGNYLTVVNASNNDQISGSQVSGSDPQAEKSPVTVADVDDDGGNELVYVGSADGKLKYLDGFGGGGSLTKAFLRDDNGDKIDGSAGTGVT